MLLVGDSGVGKSSHIFRFTDCTFSGSYLSTIGADFKTTQREIDGKVVKLQIWDTAGQERFRTISVSFYRGAAAIALVYDITDRHSFTSIMQEWIGQVKKYTSPEVVLLLVGAKLDLEGQREVTATEGFELAKELGIPFMETSSKGNVNVNECFINLAERCVKASSK